MILKDRDDDATLAVGTYDDGAVYVEIHENGKAGVVILTPESVARLRTFLTSKEEVLAQVRALGVTQAQLEVLGIDEGDTDE